MILTFDVTASFANRISLPSETNVPFWSFMVVLFWVDFRRDKLTLLGIAYNSVAPGPQDGL